MERWIFTAFRDPGRAIVRGFVFFLLGLGQLLWTGLLWAQISPASSTLSENIKKKDVLEHVPEGLYDSMQSVLVLFVFIGIFVTLYMYIRNMPSSKSRRRRRRR